MKRVFNMTILFVAIASVFVSCNKDDNKKTIENLKVAIAEETNAKAKYQAFAEKATEEGYKEVANMFRAAAFAENVHLKNHSDVLKRLGEPKFTPTAETPTVKSTAENIQAAIDGETWEYTDMYPGFIATAEKDKCNDVVETFTLAKKAEENHANRFSTVSLSDNTTVPSVFFVCTRCGGMFSHSITRCGVCQAESELQYYIPQVFDAR